MSAPAGPQLVCVLSQLVTLPQPGRAPAVGQLEHAARRRAQLAHPGIEPGRATHAGTDRPPQ